MPQCYYALLNLARDCSTDELKKSYRKMALKWHPDKNPDNLDATEKFKTIQQAYDVLSDPQERAWYDNHREAIMRGFGDGEYKDECVDLFKFFSAACYSGFEDDAGGFYSVYRKLFEDISSEDYPYLDEESEFPTFGTSQSDFDEVTRVFYGFWQSFSTARTFVWLETYDSRVAPNRQVRRLMEADNKKLREAGRKEKNEQVRALVAFVRKRDPRISAQVEKTEARAVEVERLAAERRRRQLDERKDLFQAREETTEHEAALAALDRLHNGEDESLDEQESQLYCAPCNKSFRTEKQKLNHFGSRKHVEMVTQLRNELLDQEDELDPEKLEECLRQLDSLIIEEKQTNGSQSAPSKGKKKKKRRAKNVESDSEEEVVLEQDEEDGDPILEEVNNVVPESAAVLVPEVDQTKSHPPGSTDILIQTQVDDTGEEWSLVDSTPLPAVPIEATQPVECNCETCGESFSSKTRLFKHLTTTGHAKLKNLPQTANVTKKSKKNK